MASARSGIRRQRHPVLAHRFVEPPLLGVERAGGDRRIRVSGVQPQRDVESLSRELAVAVSQGDPPVRHREASLGRRVGTEPGAGRRN